MLAAQQVFLCLCWRHSAGPEAGPGLLADAGEVRSLGVKLAQTPAPSPVGTCTFIPLGVGQ